VEFFLAASYSGQESRSGVPTPCLFPTPPPNVRSTNSRKTSGLFGSWEVHRSIFCLFVPRRRFTLRVTQ